MILPSRASCHNAQRRLFTRQILGRLSATHPGQLINLKPHIQAWATHSRFGQSRYEIPWMPGLMPTLY